MTRVVADGRDTNDLLDALSRIGIDEIAYRKGHRYLTVIVDHTTGRFVWAGEGRNQDTLSRFFDELGAARATWSPTSSCNGALMDPRPGARHAPQAVICLDPFSCRGPGRMKALDKSRYARSGIGENRSLGTDVATMMLALPSTKVPSGMKRSSYAGHERLGARVTRRR